MERAVLPLLLLSFLALLSCERAPDPSSLPEAPVAKLTDKVYVIHGPLELPNNQNLGFINNPGFVLTNKGVVIIDPGISMLVGEMVLKKIRSVTEAPVIAVFNTHIHGDHWLANSAVKQAFPKTVIYAHSKMKALADAGDGGHWIKLFNDMTGGALHETQAVAPDLAVENSEVVKLGDTSFRIHHTGRAHTDGDIMIEVIEESVVFLGDNAVSGLVPPIIDNIKGNIIALESALKINAKHYVPGHGLSGGPETVKPFLIFLQTLIQSVKQYYSQGMSDFEMKPKVAEALTPYQSWVDFDAELGRHVSRAYLEIEAEAF
jgi:glyoxylase-like metal-dependent hydrolase (beta-lactamase superfamily II)